MTVQQAASRLGISAEAVRARIQRGTLAHTREEGKVYVLLDRHDDHHDGDKTERHNDRHNGIKTFDHTELVEELRDRVEHLKGIVATRDEEIRRRDHIIAALTERIPELPAASSAQASSQRPSDGSETAPETVRGEEDAKGHAGAQMGSEAPRRSFWSRLFGR